jgi:hypothetical protein
MQKNVVKSRQRKSISDAHLVSGTRRIMLLSKRVQHRFVFYMAAEMRK